MTTFLHISNDPTTLGEAATATDLRAYAEQLGSELSSEFEADIVVRVESRNTTHVSGPDADLVKRVRARALEIEQGDGWVQVLRRSTASASAEGSCGYCGSDRVTTAVAPAVSADAAWARLATEHARDCEWVATRAHRLHVTDAQVGQLRAEALTASDAEQVDLCDRAAAGEGAARAMCARVIDAAQALAD